MKTYSFDGHDRTSELSGHLKLLLLETVDMVNIVRQDLLETYHNHWMFNSNTQEGWFSGFRVDKDGKQANSIAHNVVSLLNIRI